MIADVNFAKHQTSRCGMHTLETAKIIFSNRKRVEQQGGHFCSPAYTPPERRLGYAEARRSVEICRLPRFYQQSGKWKGTREGERGKASNEK